MSGKPDEPPDEPPPPPRRDTPLTGIPIAIDKLESQPVSSGRVHAVTGAEPSTRTHRLGAAAADVLGGGLNKLGSGVEALGGVVGKLGDVTNKVPLIGSSVATLGAGITTVGESLSELPRVAATRQGRVLLRGMAVGFIVVFAWIVAIVGYQLHDNDPTDFRPLAERILVQLSSGSAGVDAVYEAASPRFQEMVREERFEREMADQLATIGRFREITAINDTLMTTGPSGPIGRVSLTAAYSRGLCRGSVSFHYDDGDWKLLGVGIEVPPELTVLPPGTKRSSLDDVCPPQKGDELGAMDPKDCSLHAAAAAILVLLRNGRAGEVWDAATPVFQREEERTMFEQVTRDRAAALGAYKRIVAVTEAMYAGPDQLTATFDGLVEYDRGVARTVFGFARARRAEPWLLRSFRVAVPMPRAAAGSAH